MRLEELSIEYHRAAEPLRERLKELRKRLREADDPEDVWHLKRRIAELEPMLTQMNELAWLTENFYKTGGADYDFRYGFNGKRKARLVKQQEAGDLTPDLARRIKRVSAPNVLGVPLRGEDHGANRRRAGRQQKHRLADTTAGGTEGAPDHAVHLAADSKLLDKFFNP